MELKLPIKVSRVRSQDAFELVFQLGSHELLISLEKELARMHLITQPPMRGDREFWFAKDLEILEGFILTKIERRGAEVELHFEKGDQKYSLICDLTAHPQAYLIEQNGKVIKTTNKKAHDFYTRTHKQATEHADVELWANELKQKKLFIKEKTEARKLLVKKSSSFDKALANAMRALEKSKRFKEAHHVAELVKAHYGLLKRGMSELNLTDWEGQELQVTLDPRLTPKETLEDLFTKSQKLQKAIEPLQNLLQKLASEHERIKQALETLETIDSLEALAALKEEVGITAQAAPKIPIKKMPYHIFHSQKGVEILVGKNSESNHTLTFHVAHGSDLWLHAHAVSGAHVVVRKKKEHEVDPETLQDALQLALYYSKARTQKIGHHEVLVTEQKYVSRTQNMPKGKVLVSRHKIMNCVLDLERIALVKQKR